MLSLRIPPLRMIWLNAKIGHQNLLACWFVAAALRLDGHEHLVEPRQRLRVVEVQYPALLLSILGEQSQAHLRLVVAAAPGLERNQLIAPNMFVQVVAVEHKRGVLRVENSPERLGGFAVVFHIVDVRDVEIPRSNQIANLPVMGEELLIERQQPVLLIQR
ncbi:hypothetical protein ACP_3217 [Acidobacterium capsulatum ATCC 51196]|uniref:Uncharacterized protein n=1 Tax=Acidobacterium capsulatum (strain ATCC 51196 / DSM 11244 / BCRC 80197 / JCM 7670 / NBRC 15755 / NCIMB 13165 / 161) TaxID=240015 RepID=C1F5N8_ACIC5|nr:hypothetical protein ACP_3217 [Acidobacterium capsulatum ATCC 51196]